MPPSRFAVCFALALPAAPLLAVDAPLLTAAAYSGAASTVAKSTSLTYRCEGGKTITAVIELADPGTTTINVEGDPALQGLKMRDLMSANGAKTRNGTKVWWAKGDEGFLAEEDPPHGSGEVIIGGCKVVRTAPF